ncbi:hypothetical protein AAG906_024520 [Vitis piasezkii]
MVVETNATFDHQQLNGYTSHDMSSKELAENTTSRRTNPHVDKPLIIPSSVISIEMPILAASNSTQQSPPPTSNDYSPSPPPTLNFENSIDPKIVPQEPDNTSNNPIV